MTRGLKITAVTIMTIIIVNDHGHTWYRRERGSEESWPAGWLWWSCSAPAERRRPFVFRGLPTWGKASCARLRKSFLTSCVGLSNRERCVALMYQIKERCQKNKQTSKVQVLRILTSPHVLGLKMGGYPANTILPVISIVLLVVIHLVKDVFIMPLMNTLPVLSL